MPTRTRITPRLSVTRRFAALAVLLLSVDAGRPLVAQSTDAPAEEARRHVAVLVREDASADARVEAEVALENLPAVPVIDALLPYVDRRMPEGGIWNSGGREGDRRAPAAWQIHYAVHRLFLAKTQGPDAATAVGPHLVRLLGTEARHSGMVIAATYRCWIPEMEAPLAKMVLDASEPQSARLGAARILAYFVVAPIKETLLAEARKAPANIANPWLTLLMEQRVKVRTGILPEVVDLGFAALEAEANRSLANPAGAYFFTRGLGSYLGVDLSPPPGSVPPSGLSEEAMRKLVETALAWRKANPPR